MPNPNKLTSKALKRSRAGHAGQVRRQRAYRQRVGNGEAVLKVRVNYFRNY